jgi:hypothetical protein
MNLTVSGENLDLGEALRQPVLEKVEATVAGAFGGSVNSHAAMTRLWLGRNPKKLEIPPSWRRTHPSPNWL